MHKPSFEHPEAQQKLKDFKDRNSFWQHLQVHDNFAAYCKKEFSAKDIEANLSVVPEFKTLVGAVDREVLNLKSMHKANTGK